MKNIYDLVEDYLHGELSEEQLELFEKEMTNDPALRDEVNKQRLLIRKLDTVRLRNKVKESINSSKDKQTFSKTFIWAAAASLLLVTTVVFLFNRDHVIPDPIIVDNTNPTTDEPKVIDPGPVVESPAINEEVDNTIDDVKSRALTVMQSLVLERMVEIPLNILRNTEEDSLTQIQTLFQSVSLAYSKQNYNKVLQILNRSDIKKETEEMIMLQGQAYLKLRKFVQAEQSFKKLRTSFQYRYDAQWNEMLSKLGQENNRDAVALLSAIIKDEHHPYQQKAIALKKQLNF